MHCYVVFNPIWGWELGAFRFPWVQPTVIVVQALQAWEYLILKPDYAIKLVIACSDFFFGK